ncbi:MAG: M48 family metallopeptidase [Lachnospiraceae bacterium]|nr:M48 family metallopeptidase [Lachnospiraceae bacterium]
MYEYTLIRSQRKTMAIQVKNDGQLVVRAPMRMSQREIQQFVQSHSDWIAHTQEKLAAARKNMHTITQEEREKGIQDAVRIIPERVAYYATRMGVTYGRITIREQKTRWGSCSAAGNLNFNWKLMLVPPELLDYVVVHELAHRREMNHSARFWAIVEQEMPDYRERRAQLKNINLEIE